LLNFITSQLRISKTTIHNETAIKQKQPVLHFLQVFSFSFQYQDKSQFYRKLQEKSFLHWQLKKSSTYRMKNLSLSVRINENQMNAEKSPINQKRNGKENYSKKNGKKYQKKQM